MLLWLWFKEESETIYVVCIVTASMVFIGVATFTILYFYYKGHRYTKLQIMCLVSSAILCVAFIGFSFFIILDYFLMKNSLTGAQSEF